MIFEVECQCAGEAINPGQTGCIPVVGRDKFEIFFHYTDSTGAKNGITAGTVMNQAWLVALLNQTDATKRWFIAPEIFALEAAMPTNETEDIDGIPIPTGEETKTAATYQHVGASANPALKAFYDSIKCFDLGKLTITKKGQIAGMSDGAGNLVGVHLQEGTLSAQYQQPTKGVLQKVMVSYLVDDLENDANRDFIASDDIAYGTVNWFLNQPIEVIPLEVSNSGTITFTLDGLYGGVSRKAPVAGIVSADISPDLGVTPATAYNSTSAANVGFTIVESTLIPGQYVGTLAVIATPGDVIEIDLFKSGYHMRTLSVTMVAS